MDKSQSPDDTLIPVQVCYASADHAILLDLQVKKGSDIQHIIHQSGILDKIPERSLIEGFVAESVIGIFGKKKPLTTIAQAHDRIEIYRPLQSNPKEARRLRAEKTPAKSL